MCSPADQRAYRERDRYKDDNTVLKTAVSIKHSQTVEMDREIKRLRAALEDIKKHMDSVMDTSIMLRMSTTYMMVKKALEGGAPPKEPPIVKNIRAKCKAIEDGAG